MTNYTDAVGGAPIQTSEVNYLNITLSANTTYTWPYANADTGNVVALLNDVTAGSANLTFGMPDATQVSAGEYAVIGNIGSNTFTVTDNGGNTIQAIAAGNVYYIYVTNNNSTNGTWSSKAWGIGTSNLSAAGIQGNGLTTIASLLNVNYPVTYKSANYQLLSSDRAKTISSNGGAITFNFDVPANLTNGWFALIKNEGTGLVTLSPSANVTIDGNTTLIMNLQDSCFVVCDGSNLLTVGLGRITPVAVTQLIVPVTGGNTTLTAAQANNNIIQFTGTLTNNQTVFIPQALNEWNLYNNTTGAYTLTVAPATGNGTNVTIGQAVRSFYIADGTNIVSAIPAANAAIIPPSLGGSWTYYGGVSGGSANAQVISATVPSNFPQTAGDIVTFIAGANLTNSGAATLQVNATSGATIKKHSSGGLVDLVAGDIAAAGAVSVLWDGTYYQMISPTLIGSSYSGVALTLGANQSIANTSNVAIAWTNNPTDTDNYWNVSNATRITLQSAGRYEFAGQIQFDTSSAGNVRAVKMFVNGSPPASFQGHTAFALPTTPFECILPCYMPPTMFNATDYIELFVEQQTGGSLNVIGGNLSATWLSATYISPN